MKFFFNASLFMYFLGMVKYFLYLTTRRQILFVAATISIGLGFFFHTVVLGLRSYQTGHGPYMIPFEYFTFFSWCVVLSYLIAEVRYKIKDLGSVMIPLAFMLLAYAWHLPWDKESVYQADRFWLTMHQATAFLGYSAFTLTFAVGIMFVIQERALKTKKLGPLYYRLPPLEVLDHVNKVAIDVGYPLLTIAFISGIMWGHRGGAGLDIWKAWPMIFTWLIYSVIFFGRITAGWRGRRAAKFGIIGFAAVIVGYIIHIY